MRLQTSQQTYEDLWNGQLRLNLETSADLTVSRPNKIRIERYGLERHQIFFFNGVQYYQCGANYYLASYQEGTLVYVIAEPPS